MYRILIFIVASVVAACNPASNEEIPKVNRLKVNGKDLRTPAGNSIQLKGLNWGWWGTAQPDDASQAVTMSANVIRMPFRWYFGGQGSDIRQTGAPGNIKPEGLIQLDQYIDWCMNQKLWVILFAGSDQGAGDAEENYWTNPKLRQEFIDTWKFLVERYRDRPYIAAYEILSEPHPKRPATGEDVKLFYEELIKEIRKVDTETPLMIGANDHYDINLMDEVLTTIDDNIIYTFNFYLPTDYIKPDKREEAGLPIVSYPSTFTDFDGQVVTLNKDYLADVLQPALDFRQQHNVPIFVNQVGARSRCPGHLEYMTDVGELFFTNKVPFTYWTFRTRDDQTQYGLYWYDKESDTYIIKQDQFNLLSGIFSQK